MPSRTSRPTRMSWSAWLAPCAHTERAATGSRGWPRGLAPRRRWRRSLSSSPWTARIGSTRGGGRGTSTYPAAMPTSRT